MDPQGQFCHNPDCSDRGQSGLGNIRIHSRKEQRYCCSACGRTFVAAFGFDERTVAQWQARAGEHCQEVHQHLVEQGQIELGQVQAAV
jgi:hypothetical protein